MYMKNVYKFAGLDEHLDLEHIIMQSKSIQFGIKYIEYSNGFEDSKLFFSFLLRPLP